VAGVPTPRVDAEFLLAHVLGVTRSALPLVGELGTEAETMFWGLLARRVAREPLAYVLGEWGFRRLNLKVDRRVLVPRPETEALVERCLELLRDLEAPAVLDVGVGSGAIALAVADEHPGARVTGIDTSADAVAVARENADRLGLEVRLEERDGAELGESQWDLVVANPPYVDPAEIGELEPEVRDWEPRAALVGPGTTERIAEAALRALRPGGRLVLEVGDGQAKDVTARLSELGYEAVASSPDLAGRARIAEGRRPADLETVVQSLLAGRPAILPADTVYGLYARPDEEAVRRLYGVKGRREEQPTALLGRDVDALIELVPELAGETEALLRALLPGAFTIVVPNPARRLPWLAGKSPAAIGVRVPEAPPPLAAVLARVPVLAATSANLPGGPNPRRRGDLEPSLVAACLVLDGGELPGLPSTVVDVTGAVPRVLREGAVPARDALERIAARLA
jgi:release factor glutamine methyltransferase